MARNLQLSNALAQTALESWRNWIEVAGDSFLSPIGGSIQMFNFANDTGGGTYVAVCHDNESVLYGSVTDDDPNARLDSDVALIHVDTSINNTTPMTWFRMEDNGAYHFLTGSVGLSDADLIVDALSDSPPEDVTITSVSYIYPES